MTLVLCLVADPARAPLEPQIVAEVARSLNGRPNWLADSAAVEIQTERPAALVGAAVAEMLAGQPMDHAVLPAQGRRKRLLISDMDSTMITVECIDELADFAGIKDQIAAVTRRAMNGEIDFPTALRSRVALLAGLPASVIQRTIDERVRLMSGAGTLVATMRANGAYAALVSGGFTGFTGHVRTLLGFDMDEANELEIEDGRLTGRLVEPLRDASTKLATLNQLIAQQMLAPEETLAVGDGANDLPMLGAAGLGVAFRAHPVVRAQARVSITHGDLTALLYLQGYASDTFVTA